ncbi:MAG: hypothetical protein Q8L81_16625 [Bacteroidota bacterium]|nr:hypothetical protein [Bacteroidota bacterium]
MTQEEQYAILEKFSDYSVYVPALLCIYKVKALNKSLWALFVYLLACLISDRVSLLFIENERVLNIVSNSFTIFESSLICFIYFSDFSNKKIRLGIILTYLTLIILSFIVFVIQKKYDKVDTIISPIGSAIITVLAGSYLITFLLDPNILKLYKHYFYWVNFAFLLYFSVAALLFLSNNFLNTCKPSTLYLVWGIHLILNVIKNLLFAVGIWMKKNIQ